ncbi:hypothetical protein D9M72_632760 [compost metagenome]
MPPHRKFTRDVSGERGFAYAAFLVEQGDDHGLAPAASEPLFAVVHRNGALLPVMLLKLGALEIAETRAVIGFAADSHA